MEDLRTYYHRGTQDCPIAVYYMSEQKFHRVNYTHWHDEAELWLATEGSVSVFVDNTIVHLQPGDIILIEPGVMHGLRQVSEDALWWQLFFAQDALSLPAHHFFQQQFVQPLFQGKLRFPRPFNHDHPAYSEIFSMMSRLSQCKMGTAGYKLRRFSTVISICSALAPYCTREGQSFDDALPENAVIRSTVIYIHERSNRKLTLQKLASRVHLHPNYLCSLFKKYMGESLFQFIARNRIENAARLLRNEDLPIGKIAELVGFGSGSEFYKKFKEFTGTSPLAYKKQNRNRPAPITDEDGIV